jgi:hypothetical protein
MYLYIDIETVPSPMAPDERAALVKAPANYKDEAKIAAYIAEHAEEEYRRGSLDYRRGDVLSIGAAMDDGPVFAWIDTEHGGLACLDALWAEFEWAFTGRQAIRWVGHNVKGFDLPWLWRLAVKDGHPLADHIPHDKWGNNVDDTMELWAGTDYRHKASLADIAAYLGIKGKSGHGSEVYGLFVAGELDQIRAYQAQDVEVVREVHRRLTGRGNAGARLEQRQSLGVRRG